MRRMSTLWVLFLFGSFTTLSQNSISDFEALINDYVVRCEGGTPRVIPLPKRGGYLVETSDSTWVSFPDGGVHKMLRKDLENEHAHKFSEYFHIGDSLFLAHGGAGVVYNFNGQTLKRVDESYYHHNQYGATRFSYKGSLFLFGGSGLFSHKNFITRYDLEAREWLLQEADGQKPFLALSAAGIVIGDYFYVLGEPFVNPDQYNPDFSKEIQKRFVVYRLNLKSWHWDLLGSVSPELSQRIYDTRLWEIDPEKGLLYINGPKGFFRIDFEHNSIVEFDNTYPMRGSTPFLGMNAQELWFLYCDSRQFIKGFSITESELEERKVNASVLYEANLSIYYNTLLEVIAVLFFVSLVLIVINELKFEKRIVIRLKGGSILFRSRNIRVFSPEEKELLMELATSEALSFSDLEDIVSFPKDSQSVRVKKRDRVLRVLNEKIATIFNHDSAKRHDYFTVQNSSDDKRSRLLGLNGEYFKVM